MDKSKVNQTTSRVLWQLQQNQSLRVQIFRLKSSLRDQHHHFLNSTVNLEMLAEKIMTQLMLAERKAKQSKQSRQFSAIDRSIEDLQCLIDSIDRIRNQWSKTQCQSESNHYQKLLQDCSIKFDQAGEIIEKLNQQKSIQTHQLSMIKQQLNDVNEKYGHCLMQNAELKQQFCVICQDKNRLEQDYKLSSAQNERLKVENERSKHYNDQLSEQLKQSRDMANKHTQYLKRKCQEIQRQNKRLVELQRQSIKKENQFIRIIEQGDVSIRNLCQENHRLKLELQHFQVQFQEIIEKEEKIKMLETMKNKRRQQRQPLREVETQNIPLNSKIVRKQVGKMTKKFDLQSFQQKLSNCASLQSFYPH